MAVLELTVPGRISQPAREVARLGAFRRRFDRWIALGQYGFPFAIGRYGAPVGRLRALARRSRFGGMSRLRRVPLQVAMTVSWPFGAFFMALKERARMRERGQAPNSLRILLDMYWLALRHSIPPIEYALYQFNDSERRKDVHEYVYWNDLPGLALLNARLGADNRDVQDKDRFAEICARYGYPHVPTLAVFDHGRKTGITAPFIPDAPVLWVKSLRLKSGAGGAKWTKDGDSYYNEHNRRIRADKIADEFRKQDCLVQPYIENHPIIARMSNGALASLRIVTGINAKGEAEFVTALIALPHGACDTSIAGILCSVEPKTSRVRNAVLLDEPVIYHPDTGAQIIGTSLPFWRECVELVRRAHGTAFYRFPFLGWDIALTKEGPVLLEANSGWGAISHQMLDGPLGRTVFSRLVGHYV